MADLQEIGLDAVFRTDKFQAGLDQYLNGFNQAQQQTQSFGSVLLGVGDGIGFGLTAPLSAATTVLGAFAVAGKVAWEAVELLGQGIEAVATTGLAMNESIENTAIRLETLTGMGQETLKWVRELSVATPFTTDQLSQILATAKAYGYTTEEAKALTVTVGEVGAAQGNNYEIMQRVVSAFGQMNQAGRVNAQDMKQLTDAGIDAWGILATKMGMSTEELRRQVEQGKVLASDAIPALREAIDNQYGGALERASRSGSALTDTLKENIQLATADVTLPLYEKFKDLLAGITDELTGPGFQGAIVDLTELVADLSAGFDPSAFVAGFRSIIQAADDAIGFIRQVVDEVRGLSGSDILASASTAISENNAALAESEAKLQTAHANTLAKFQRDIDGLGSSLNSQIENITEGYADKFEALDDRLAKAGASFANAQEKADRELGQKLTDNAKALNDKLESLADSHSDKMAGFNDRLLKAQTSLNEALEKAGRSLADKLLDNERALQEKLDSLAESHASRRESLEASIADKQSDTQQRLADMQATLQERIQDATAKYGDQRATLEEQLAAATTDADRATIQSKINALNAQEQLEIQKLQEKAKRDADRLEAQTKREIEALQAKIAKEDAEYEKAAAKERARAELKNAQVKADYDQQVADLQKRYDAEAVAIAKLQADEDAKYAEQVGKEQQRAAEKALRIQQDHDYQIQDLQRRLGEESAEIDKQRAKLQGQQDADIAAAKERNAAQVADLQRRIEEENAAYATQAAKLRADAEAENAAIMQRAQERAEAIGQGPAHEIAITITNILEAMQKLYDFLLNQVAPVLIQVAAYINDQVIGALDRLRAWFDENSVGITAALLTIQEIGQKAWNALTETITADAAPEIKEALDILGKTFEDLGISWETVAQVLSAVIITVAGVIAGALVGASVAIKAFALGFSDFVEGVKTLWQGWALYFEGVWDVIAGIFTLDGPRIIRGFGKEFQGVVLIIEGAVLEIKGIVEGVLGGVLGFIGGFVAGITDFFITLSDDLVGHSIIPDMLDQIVDAFEGIDWLGLGADIIDGIIRGVINADVRLLQTMTSLATRALQAARDAVGAHSPALKGIEFGVDIVDGITQGIAGAFDEPIGLMQALAGGLTSPGLLSGARLPNGSNITNISTTRVFAPNVNANYAQTQSPVKIMDDLHLLGMGA